MAILSIGTEALGRWTWRVFWTATGGGPFYVWLDGALVTTTLALETRIVCDAGDPCILEVLDTADPPAQVFAARITLGWYHVAGATSYEVQELVGAAWVTRKKIADNGEWHFAWTSRALEDVTTHQFRIVPVSTTPGTPRPLTVFMVRHPDPPAGQFAYDPDSRKVTVDL